MSRNIAPARGALLLAMALPLAACATSEPINLSSQFMPPGANWSPTADRLEKGAAGSCRIHLVSIRDVRSDTQSMGAMVQRPVRAADSVGWVRSGVQSLSLDTRIRFADEPTTVVFSVDLAKAYASSAGTVKSATVVLQVTYGPDDTKVFRGDDTSLNWNNTESETQAALNAALARSIEALDQDVVARCSKSA